MMTSKKKQTLPCVSRSALIAILLALGAGSQALAQEIPTPEPAPLPSDDSPLVPEAETSPGLQEQTPAGEATPNNSEAPPLPGEDGEIVTRSDGEILQVLKVLSEAEIGQAELALEEASSQEVKDSAQEIIADHASTIERIDALLVASGVSLVESPLSNDLLERAQASAVSLEELSGTEFECRYLEQKVDDNQLAMETVDYQLLPFARSVTVRNFLSERSSRLEQSALEARQTHESLGQCS